jgi:hypothetical protein
MPQISIRSSTTISEGVYRTGYTPPVTLLLDTFTAPDDTAITSHTPDIQAVAGSYSTVSTYGGAIDYKILSNVATGTAASISTGVAVIETGQTDVTVIADINRNNTRTVHGGAGIAFRWDSTAGSGYFVDFLNDTIRLAPFPTGTVQTAAFSFSTTTTYEMKAVLSGSSIKVYMDDVLYLDLTDSTYSGTEHGVSITANSSGANSTADNLRVIQ